MKVKIILQKTFLALLALVFQIAITYGMEKNQNSDLFNEKFGANEKEEKSQTNNSNNNANIDEENAMDIENSSTNTTTSAASVEYDLLHDITYRLSEIFNEYQKKVTTNLPQSEPVQIANANQNNQNNKAINTEEKNTTANNGSIKSSNNNENLIQQEQLKKSNQIQIPHQLQEIYPPVIQSDLENATIRERVEIDLTQPENSELNIQSSSENQNPTNNSPNISTEKFVCTNVGCTRSFPTSRGLQIHMGTCNRKTEAERKQLDEKKQLDDSITYKCNYCDYVTDFYSTLRAHTISAHKEYYTFECKHTDCNRLFATNQQLMVHQKIHQGSLDQKCDIGKCQFKCNSQKSLTLHKNQKHNMQNTQEIDASHEARPAKQREIDNQSSEPSVAPNNNDNEIQEITNNELNIQPSSENQNSTNNSETTSTEKFLCNNAGCGRRFGNARSLSIHKSKCDKKNETQRHQDLGELIYKCDVCSYVANRISHLDAHKVVHSDKRPYLCKYPNCDSSFKTNTLLTKHKKIHEEPLNCKCNINGCQFSCNAERHLTNHQKKNHNIRKEQLIEKSHPIENTQNSQEIDPEETESDEERPTKKTRNFQCTEKDCCSNFKSKRLLKLHKKIHDGLLNCKCDIPECEFTCNNSVSLRLHKDEKHNIPYWNNKKRKINRQSSGPSVVHTINDNEKEIQNNELNIQPSIENQNSINNSENTPVEKFLCTNPGCNRSWMNAHALHAHTISCKNKTQIEREQLNKRLNFRCDLCNFATHRKDNLEVHKRVHSDNRPYRCEYPNCNSDFKEHNSLSKHMKIHEGSLIQCNIDSCEFACNSEYSLSRHKNKNHNIQPRSSKKRKRGTTEPNSESVTSQIGGEELSIEKNQNNQEVGLDKDELDQGPSKRRKTDIEAALESANNGLEEISNSVELSQLAGNDNSINDTENRSVEKFLCTNPGCNRSFISIHTLTAHKNKICDNKTPAERTQLTNRLNFRCEICDFACKKKNTLDTHKKNHLDERPFACEFTDCNSCFKTSSDLIRHKKMHEGSLIQCNIDECQFACNSEKTLKTHKNKNHFTQTPHSKKRKRGTIETNSESTISQISVNENLIQEDLSIEKNQNNQEIGLDKDELDQAASKRRKTHDESELESDNNSLEEIPNNVELSQPAENQNVINNPENKPAEKILCTNPGCNRSFINIPTLTAHKNKSCDNKTEKEREQISNKLKFQCDSCDFACKKKETLNRHKRHHLDERPFTCENTDCNSRFKTSDALIRHKKMHEGSLIKCNIGECQFACNSGNALSKHKNKNHNTQSKSSKKRKRRNTETNSKSATNQISGEELSTEKNQNIQEITPNENESDQRPSKRRKTDDESTLESENDVLEEISNSVELSQPDENQSTIDNSGNTSAEKFLCTNAGCNRSFINVQALTTHKITCDNKTQTERVQLNKTLNFRCKICEFACNRKNIFKAHRTTHSDKRPFICRYPNCNASFKRNCSLTVHKKMHEGNLIRCNVGECKFACNSGNALGRHKNKNHNIEDQSSKKRKRKTTETNSESGINQINDNENLMQDDRSIDPEEVESDQERSAKKRKIDSESEMLSDSDYVPEEILNNVELNQPDENQNSEINSENISTEEFLCTNPGCNRSFSTERGFIVHKTSCDKKTKSERIEYSKKLIYKCKFCAFVTHAKSLLNSHTNKHSKENKSSHANYKNQKANKNNRDKQIVNDSEDSEEISNLMREAEIEYNYMLEQELKDKDNAANGLLFLTQKEDQEKSEEINEINDQSPVLDSTDVSVAAEANLDKIESSIPQEAPKKFLPSKACPAMAITTQTFMINATDVAIPDQAILDVIPIAKYATKEYYPIKTDPAKAVVTQTLMSNAIGIIHTDQATKEKLKELPSECAVPGKFTPSEEKEILPVFDFKKEKESLKGAIFLLTTLLNKGNNNPSIEKVLTLIHKTLSHKEILSAINNPNNELNSNKLMLIRLISIVEKRHKDIENIFKKSQEIKKLLVSDSTQNSSKTNEIIIIED